MNEARTAVLMIVVLAGVAALGSAGLVWQVAGCAAALVVVGRAILVGGE